MLQSLIVGAFAGSSGTGTGGNYGSSGTGTGGQDYGSSGTGTGGNYGSSGTGTGQGGQGYGVAGMIPGTEANREKKADQGQYGVPQLCNLSQANARSCSHTACCCASAVAGPVLSMPYYLRLCSCCKTIAAGQTCLPTAYSEGPQL